MATLDHIAVSAATLEAGTAHVAACLSHDMGPGGTHDRMGTWNRLSGLGPGEYLEVIAIDPTAASPEGPRWFGLDVRSGPPRLSNWILRVGDLDAVVARRPEAGRPVAFARGPYRWRMAVPEDGMLPFDGAFPALIEWETAPPTFAETSLRLTALVLRHPEAEGLRAALDGLIRDDRITIETGGPAALVARLDTPVGPRTLA
jgi:hypothetical protein